MRKLLKETCQVMRKLVSSTEKGTLKPVAMVIRLNEWLPWNSMKRDILILCVGARARGDFWRTLVPVIVHINLTDQKHCNETVVP